ncbi:MAG: hypothetical protein ABI419_07440 [Ginsengibacter sp.]
MPIGYSNKILSDKLGITDSQKILLMNQPEEYDNLIEKNIKGQLCKKGELPDLIHLFAASKNEFEKQMRFVLKNIKPTTVIWASWYKKSSGIATDLTGDIIRNFALQNGLVDVKVCAVSDNWSGLKLVVPLKLRKKGV